MNLAYPTLSQKSSLTLSASLSTTTKSCAKLLSTALLIILERRIFFDT
ncbi:unnamed protein product [Oikopleura dioica]|uniref:Uncharacterized protein n=1 Tax=Oikopleura dioica TaxID=34765 RepID=E4YCE7_OIKDI|nr:unnamed protein product [Oikopleura dioica]